MAPRPSIVEDETALATQLRAERKRLGLSVAAVAHFCGVAHTTVVNWETNKARMPFVAAIELWRRGFDMERMVRSRVPEEAVRMFGTEDYMAVSGVLLLRHRMAAENCFIYRSPSRLGSHCAEGELCLMRVMTSYAEDIIEQGEGIYLVSPKSRIGPFLCRFEMRPKERIRVEAGTVGIDVPAQRLLGCADVAGKLLCGLGLMPGDDPKDGDHSKALKALGKMLR